MKRTVPPLVFFLLPLPRWEFGASLTWLKVAEAGIEHRTTTRLCWGSSHCCSQAALVRVEGVQRVVDMLWPVVPGAVGLLHKRLFLLLFLMGGSWHLVWSACPGPVSCKPWACPYLLQSSWKVDTTVPFALDVDSLWLSGPYEHPALRNSG